MFRADISYLIGGDVPQLKQFLLDRHKTGYQMYSFGEKFEWTEDSDYTDGYQFHVVAPLGKGEIFYVWVEEPSHYLLFHETEHLTGDILYDRGIKYCMESEEMWAYLGGWIWQELNKVLKRRKAK